MQSDLNPDLLITPFSVQTNWHVITGAPCSGKSTLIDQLSARGFQTTPEAARQYFEREMAATGRSIDEIRREMVPCTQAILNLMLKIEHALDPNETVFLDRGFPDCLAFIRQIGMDPNLHLPDCFHYRYASVFMLDRFPVQIDEVRIEDESAAKYLDHWHYCDYSTLGYQVVRVPVLPPRERLTFVLEQYLRNAQIPNKMMIQ